MTTQRDQLSPEAQEHLREIIHDPDKAAKFINVVKPAMRHFRTIRSANAVNVFAGERRRLQSVKSAAQAYVRALRELTHHDKVNIAQGCCIIGGHDTDASNLFRSTWRSAKLTAESSAVYLRATRPARRGRRVESAGIILVNELADAFRELGLTASSGDRSRFVQALAVINDDLSLGWADVRQKVRDCLRGKNST